MNAIDFPARLELASAPIAALDLALYAAASGDHNPLHLDAEVARAAGFDRPVVQGMLSMAYAARLFTNTFGLAGLMRLETRFVGVALRGQRLVFEAELTSREGDTALYSLRGRTDTGVDIVAGQARVCRPTGQAGAHS